MAEQKIVAQKKLPGENKYQFCFHCLDREKDTKNLQPLFLVTTLEEQERTIEGEKSVKKIFDSHYFCPVCKATFTVQDFENRYCCRPDRTKWTEKPREENYYGI